MTIEETSKFKVGDWVRRKSEVYNKIDKIDSSWRLKYSTEKFKDNIKEDCELWQPQVGEWCWFWTKVNNAKFGRYIEDSNTYGYNYVFNELKGKKRQLAKHCEPFIGTLPSFVKE